MSNESNWKRVTAESPEIGESVLIRFYEHGDIYLGERVEDDGQIYWYANNALCDGGEPEWWCPVPD